MATSLATFPPLIYLLGMPGCGKSSVGKLLAQTLAYQFLDLDDLLVEQENATIAQIFAQYGQDYFRQAEAKALRNVTLEAGKGVVLATGGGAPCFENNMAFMVGRGLPVYLEVSVVALVARLTPTNLQIRPLLQGKSAAELAGYLRQTLAHRELFYRQAPLVVNVDTQRVADAAQDVLQHIKLFSSIGK